MSRAPLRKLPVAVKALEVGRAFAEFMAGGTVERSVERGVRARQGTGRYLRKRAKRKERP